MENVKSFSSKNKNSTYNEKKSEDSSHQALTYFRFSEFLFSDFRHNKLLKFLMKNNMAKFREFIERFDKVRAPPPRGSERKH
jgi:hypothetical protein